MEYQVFRDWLLLKAPTDTVGIAADRCDCPLARCFGGIVTYTWRNWGGNKAKLPLWARDFARKVDDFQPLLGHVTAATALRILDTVEH